MDTRDLSTPEHLWVSFALLTRWLSGTGPGRGKQSLNAISAVLVCRLEIVELLVQALRFRLELLTLSGQPLDDLLARRLDKPSD
jgi:hypothetical protein